ncbi:MAG: molybdopterin synthase sulfur carrier subunit [Microbacterium sp.]|jgi:molybdopterin synthase sulfur carrier subunit|uniref:MoaD/ThiS family protein n=1 Tax=unclassified Microbacterium TaxID=2609290 RepID=UPI000DB02F15|nr:MoaD/ThiS family protein [Microbacterium sp.]PZU40241.1 MAG: molybdopterin synthase sulfur carrier subunit [Microbacterium sp.]
MARVRYFAAAEEAAGRDEESRDETTLGALRAALVADYPALAGILPRCAVLVGGARVSDVTPLAADATIDVLPPFAGG